MVFKRMLGALGVGAPSVDTVLSSPRVQPGGLLTGEVRIKGGDFDADIEHVALGLVARVEAEHGDSEMVGVMEFQRAEVSGPFRLRAGEDRTIPWQMSVPWETPISNIQGYHLTGMAMGVRTELAIAKAVDKGDLDAIEVAPLPSQERVLQGLVALGCQFKSADLESGRIYGVAQSLPFYQEIEFYPPAHAGHINEIELTFVASPAGLDIILEADKRSGLFGSHDALGRFQVTHAQALQMDWAAEINSWLNSLVGYGSHGSHHGGYHGHPGHYEHPQHPQHHQPGWGAVAAAGAAGVVGGFVAAEIVEELVEDDEDGGGDGDW